MSRRYNIRWSEADEAELQRVVKNFNAKLSRLAKKDPKNKSALPERVSAAQLRDMITTRQDLNRELNSLRRFSERGAEEFVTLPDTDNNLKVTKWQRKEYNMLRGIVNKKRKRERERIASIDMTDRGEKLGYKVGQIGGVNVGGVGMGSTELNQYRDVSESTFSMNRAEWNKRFRAARKEAMSDYWQKRNEIMRENYIDAIKRNFPDVNTEDIVKEIEEMDFDEFRKIVAAENQKKFEYNYPQDKDEQEQYATALRAMWIPNK